MKSRFFLGTAEQNQAEVQRNLNLQQYQIDISNPPDRFKDPFQVTENMTNQQFIEQWDVKPAILQQAENNHFVQNWQNDPIQSKWYRRPPLMVSNLRPADKESERNFIFVQKVADNEAKREQAISKVIEKFRQDKEKWAQEQATED